MKSLMLILLFLTVLSTAKSQPELNWSKTTASENTVFNFMLSPDGKYYAVCLAKRIFVMDTDNNKICNTFVSLGAPEGKILFTPDSKYLLHLNNYPGNFWSMEKDTSPRRFYFTYLDKGFYLSSLWDTDVAADFKPDSYELAANGYSEGSPGKDYLSLWNMETGKLIKMLDSSDISYNNVRFSPDGKYLLSSQNETAALRKTTNYAIVKSVQLNQYGFLHGAVFSGDSRYIAAITRGYVQSAVKYYIEIWSVPDLKQINKFELWDYDNVPRICFDNNNNIVYPDLHNRVAVRNVESGEIIRHIQTKSIYNADCLSCTKNGKLIITQYINGSTEVFDIVSGEFIGSMFEINDKIYQIKFSPDSKLFATLLRDNYITVFDVETGKFVDKIKSPLNPYTDTRDVSAMAFSEDNRYLGLCSNDNKVFVWQLVNSPVYDIFDNHTGVVSCLDFSPDGKYMASGGDDNIINIWDVEQGIAIYTLQGYDKDIIRLSFTKDSKSIVAFSQNEENQKENYILKWDFLSDSRDEKLFDYPRSFSKYSMVYLTENGEYLYGCNFIFDINNSEYRSYGFDDDCIDCAATSDGNFHSAIDYGSGGSYTAKFSINNVLVNKQLEIDLYNYLNHVLNMDSYYDFTPQPMLLAFSPNMKYTAVGTTNMELVMLKTDMVLSVPPELNLNELTAYPIPAVNQIILETKSDEKIAGLDVVNLFGITKLKNRFPPVNSYNLDLGNLENGIYFLRVIDETNRTRVMKIIVSK